MCQRYLGGEGWPHDRRGFSQPLLDSAPGLGAGGQIYKDLSLAKLHRYQSTLSYLHISHSLGCRCEKLSGKMFRIVNGNSHQFISIINIMPTSHRFVKKQRKTKKKKRDIWARKWDKREKNCLAFKEIKKSHFRNTYCMNTHLQSEDV